MTNTQQKIVDKILGLIKKGYGSITALNKNFYYTAIVPNFENLKVLACLRVEVCGDDVLGYTYSFEHSPDTLVEYSSVIPQEFKGLHKLKATQGEKMEKVVDMVVDWLEKETAENDV